MPLFLPPSSSSPSIHAPNTSPPPSAAPNSSFVLAVFFPLFFFFLTNSVVVVVHSSLALIVRKLRPNKPPLAGTTPGYLSLCLKAVVFVKIPQDGLALRVCRHFLEIRLSREGADRVFLACVAATSPPTICPGWRSPASPASACSRSSTSEATASASSPTAPSAASPTCKCCKLS